MLKTICSFIFHKLLGWKSYVNVPDFDKCIICVAPHTSNYDLFIGKLFYAAIGRKSGFVMKKEWFVGPLDYIFRNWMGGIPVNRGHGTALIAELIEIANQNNTFGRLINLSLNKKQSEVGNPDEQSAEIVFKLFGIIPIKKVSVEMVDDAEYYVGGVPIGIEIDTKGAIVVGKSEGSQFNAGDIITQIDEKAITNLDDLENAVQECDRDAEVKFLRKNKEFKKIVKTQKDENGRLKLGLWVKDDVSGVGTLTYV